MSADAVGLVLAIVLLAAVIIVPMLIAYRALGAERRQRSTAPTASPPSRAHRPARPVDQRSTPRSAPPTQPRPRDESDKLPEEVRDRIFHRDRWRCYVCNNKVGKGLKRNPPHHATIDHVRPKKHEGPDDDENLKTACRRCNTLKGQLLIPVERFREVIRGAEAGDEVPLSEYRQWAYADYYQQMLRESGWRDPLVDYQPRKRR